MAQHWSTSNRALQTLEGRLTCLSLLEWTILSSKRYQGPDRFREVLDKPAVEVTETNECLYLLETSWGFPVNNSLNLRRIYT